jgi:NADH-quinone oxidoreductase subunit F
MGEPRQRPPYPDPEGHRRQADGHQQRRDLGQRPRHHPPGRRGPSPRSARGTTPAPRSSAWSARSRTPAWSRCRWASRSARSSTTSAAARSARPDQGGPDRRAVGRLHPGRAVRPADRLRQPGQGGSIMGSGGMIVMDENTCMVDVAKYFMNFLKDESCGKCFTCRKGTQRMYEILDDISKGRGTPGAPRPARRAGAGGQGHHDVRPGPDGVQPGAEHAALLPRRSTSGTWSTSAATPSSASELVGAPCQSPARSDTGGLALRRPHRPGEYEEAYQVIREANPFPSVCARVCDRPASSAAGPAPAAASRWRSGRSSGSSPTGSTRRCTRPGAPRGRRPASRKVAVVGAGPAGLAAAHDLSGSGTGHRLRGRGRARRHARSAASPPTACPARSCGAEIESLLMTTSPSAAAGRSGRDITLDGLFAEGFKAVFLATWAPTRAGGSTSRARTSRRLLLHGVPQGLQPARRGAGRRARGVIGGGNSAIDAARVAIRQEDVESVTLFYRRTDQEMPAYAEEVEAALEEGIARDPGLAVKILHRRAVREGIRVETGHRQDLLPGRASGRHRVHPQPLGELDASGRRSPVPVPGSEFTSRSNTLIVAIGERAGQRLPGPMGIEVRQGRHGCGRPGPSPAAPGVFAGGDVVTGPNTVVDAIAAGKKAAA